MAPIRKQNGMKDKPKRAARRHHPETLMKAIESVKTKRYTLREAARFFNIPASTLCEKCSGKQPIAPTPCTILTPVEEAKLTVYIKEMARCGFGMTTDDVRATTKALVDLRKPPPDSDQNQNLPSSSWVYRFMGRHPELSLRTPQSLGKERSLVTPEAVSDWFKHLKSFTDGIDPTLFGDSSRIYNADESGFAFDTRAQRVLSFKGAKHVYKVTSNQKTQVTVLACMSAAGHYINPLIVYPYKRMPTSDLTADFPGATYNFSDSGWMTATIFYTWLRDVFIPATHQVKKPLLLLVDGHSSHTSLIETSLMCEENGIIMYCFIAHASHLVQPLDQAFFGSIKPTWAQATRQHIMTEGDAVNLETFAAVLQPVWDKCCTVEIAKKSFKCAGLVPFQPEKVLASGKFGPSTVYTRKADTFISTEAVTESPAPTAMNISNRIENAAEEVTSAEAAEEAEASEPTPSSSGASSCPSSSTITKPAAAQLMNYEQLKAFHNMMTFVLDDCTRNDFKQFFSVLAGTQMPTRDPKFEKFQDLLVAFRDTNFSAQPAPSHPTKKTALSVDGILKTPRFATNKGKRTKRTTLTIPHCISSKDFRQALQKKMDSKDKEDRSKLARKEREANERKKEQEKELAKRKREMQRKQKGRDGKKEKRKERAGGNPKTE